MTNLLIDKLKNSHLIRVENKEVLDTLHVIRVKEEDVFEMVPLMHLLGDAIDELSFNPLGKSYEGQFEKIASFQDETPVLNQVGDSQFLKNPLVRSDAEYCFPDQPPFIEESSRDVDEELGLNRF